MFSPCGRKTEKVYCKSCEFLVDSQIESLPVNPFDIIRANRWGLVTYQELADLLGTSQEEIIQASASCDGFTIFNGRNYCIAYNSRVRQYSRIAFTLLHEAAHIVLGHFAECDSFHNNLAFYRQFESEANFFASNVMAPYVVMRECGLLTPQLLHCACGLSHEAAERRLAGYRCWSPRAIDKKVFSNFSAFIRFSRIQNAPRPDIGIIRDETVSAAK